jgi:hypothetical protein
MLLPIVQRLPETKAHLMVWVHEEGVDTPAELFRSGAEALAGPKGGHRVDRAHHHSGKTGCGDVRRIGGKVKTWRVNMRLSACSLGDRP